MNKIEATGTISANGLKIFNRHKFVEAMPLLMRKGADVTGVKITIERVQKKRSTMENAYYWGVVVEEIKCFIDEAYGTDHTPEDIHYMLKSMFNYSEIVNESTGEVIKVPQSTKTLTTVDFELYLDKCRNFAYEFFGKMIPLPNEQSTIEL